MGGNHGILVTDSDRHIGTAVAGADYGAVGGCLAWGFAARRGRALQVDDCYQLGINDMRFFMTGKAVLVCLITFGFVRKVSIAYRCYAGDHDVGEA